MTTTIRLKLPERAPQSIPRRTSCGRVTTKKRSKITSNVIASIKKLNSNGCSYSYSQLVKTPHSRKKEEQKEPPCISAAMRNLQKRYSKALENLEKERSALSYFIAKNLEKLFELSIQTRERPEIYDVVKENE